MFRFDVQGQLIVSEDIRRIFDYFLASIARLAEESFDERERLRLAAAERRR